MTRLLALALLGLLGFGCSRPAEPPVLTGLAPDRGPADRRVDVVISGERLQPHLFTDFARRAGSTLGAAWTARLGRQPLEDVALAEDGTLHAVVPAGLTPGLYGLTVVTPSGLELSLPDAYRAVSADLLDTLVVRYEFDPVAPQRVGVPFAVTVTARDSAGAIVDGFAGTAALEDRTGTVVPRAVGPFVSGRWTGPVEVRLTTAADALTVSDGVGRTGTSNDFAVGPGPGASLRFATPPRTAVAGACSEALTLELASATGAVEVPTTNIDVALSAAPPTGLALFSDATCATPLLAPRFAAGQGALTFHFRGTRAGTPRLTAAAGGLLSATQVQRITPAAPTALAFATPPQTVTAGACSATVTLELRDTFGNPSPAAAARDVALSAVPGVGFGFFAGAGCATAATQVTVPAGAATVDVSFLGTTAGVEVMTASTAALPDATQQARITPQGFPSRVTIVSPPQTLEVGLCSGPLAVQTQDSLGNAVSSPTPVTVTLDAAPVGSLVFFLDAACTTPATTATVDPDTSTTVVYFRGAQPGALTAQVGSPGLQGDQQVQTLLPGPPAALAFSTPPRTTAAGGCSLELVVETRDASGFPTTVGASTAVSVTPAPGAGFTLYDDAACTNAVTGLALAGGSGSGRLYYRGTVVSAVTLTAQAAGLTDGQQQAQVTPAPPAQLVFVTPPHTVAAGACSPVSTVEVRDAFDNPAPDTASRALSLAAAPATGVSFFADPGCTTAASGLTVPAASTQASLFFRAAQVGSFTLSVSSAGLTAAQQTQSIIPGAPAALAFTSAAQTRTAGTCSGVAQLEVRDALGNASPVTADTTVTLTAGPAAGFSFFTDAACSVGAASVQVLTGASTATFYFRGTLAGAVTVTAASAPLTAAQQVETITAAADAALAFTTPPRTVTAGACSANLDVEVRDAFGNAAPQGAPRALALVAAPAANFDFFSDAACATPVTQVTVAAGVSSARFYVRGTTASTVTLTASSAAVTDATQAVTITAASTPSRLAFTTPPRTVVAGQCAAALTVQSRDSFDNPRAVASNTPVALSAVPAAGVTFFSDATCTTAAASVTLVGGTDSVSFYVRGGQAGVTQVTATATGLNPATQGVTVTPAAPDRLVFVTAPQTRAAGACSAVATVESRDPLGNASPPGSNTTVALTSGAGVTFYSDASCATAVTQVTLGAAATQQGFYFRGTQAGARTLTAQATGLTAATQGATFTAGAPTKLVFTSGPVSPQAGVCSTALTVQVQDAFDNPVTLGSSLPVNLSTSGVAVTLYAGACAGAVTQVTVAAGASTASFTLRGTVAGAVTVTATAAGLTPAVQAQSVAPAPADRLVFVTSPQTLAAGACSAIATVEARDPFGNASPVGSATTITLAATPATGFGFFTAAGCGTGTGTVTLAAGSAQVSFFFRGTQAGTVQTTASATGLTAASQNQTVTPGPLTSFSWDPIASPQTLAVPFVVTVRARDQYGNTATSFTGTAALSASPVATTVTCTAPCTSGTTTDTFVAGVWSGTVTLGGTAGTGRTLTATQGASSGNSGAFDVVSVNRTPPLARFTVTPRVVTTGQNVTFDASGSSDLQTPTASLQVSWDFTGAAAGPPPWSAWTTTKTATNSFGTAGLRSVRLAVRDADGDVGFAVGWVQVLSASTNRCIVDTTSNTDDGATSCTARGPDNRLSLVEAVRLSNSLAGVQTITFSGPMTITGSGYLSFSSSADVIAPSGVQLVGWIPRVTTAGATVRLYGLELSGQAFDLTVVGGATLELYDSYLHNLDGFDSSGTLVLDTVTVASCTGTLCANVHGNATVRYSHFRNSNTAIRFSTCAVGAVLDVFGTVFSQLSQGIDSDCTQVARVRNNTFHACQLAVDYYPGGANQVLVNNVFTSMSTIAVQDCGIVTFAQRSHHVLFNNANNDCLAGDPNVLTSDPTYALPASNDFRLTFGSPAIDGATDLGLDLTPGSPGNFLGAAPDRGGRESY